MAVGGAWRREGTALQGTVPALYQASTQPGLLLWRPLPKSGHKWAPEKAETLGVLLTCSEGATELSSDPRGFCYLFNHRRGSGCVKGYCADQKSSMSLFWLWGHTCCDQGSMLKGP